MGMGQEPTPETVEMGDDYIHVRFRDPDQFDTIRTPDWAENAASSVREGAEVRTGKHPNTDDWTVRSVLVPTTVDTDDAEPIAEDIVEKIAS